MVRYIRWLPVPFSVLLAFACMVCAGCDSESGKLLTIEPPEVTIGSNIGQFTLKVVGGTGELSEPLEWSVKDSSLGEIVLSAGLSALYARTSLNGMNTITVRDRYGSEGFAVVHQVPFHTESPTSTPSSNDGTDSDTEPEPAGESISDYVSVSIVSGSETISFPMETGNYSGETSVVEFWFGYPIVYDSTYTFAESGNTYVMHVELTRNTNTDVSSVTASVNATIDGQTVSGTLTYP